MDVPMDDGRMEVIKLMTYQFEFLSHIYGEEVKNSFGVYIKSGAKLEEDNTIMSILKGNLPEKTNVSSSTNILIVKPKA